MNILFTGPFILLAYCIGAFAIISGSFNSYIPLIISLLILFIWDVLYIVDKDSFKGRTLSGINDSVTRARTYISWYIGLYGVIIGLTLTKSNEMSQFATALSNSNTPVWVVALPLLLSIISMLFIPIQIGDQPKGQEKPNIALKSLFFAVVFLQKIILILIGNTAVRVMTAWS